MPTLVAGMHIVSEFPHARRKRGHDTLALLKFRRGLTLIEVTLVLALIVVLASFCWPAINKAFSIQRLKKSADIVRIQWCKSRVKAMDGDRIVMFRYEMGGSRFRIEQLADASAFENAFDDLTPDPDALANAETLSDPSLTSPGGPSPNDDYPSGSGLQSLPKGVVFRGCEIENDSRAMTAGQVTNTPSSAGQVSNMPTSAGQVSNMPTDVNWSAPIYFYPDGTSSSARLQICNDRNCVIELALRGMTGVVKVGEVNALEGAVP